MSYQERRDRLAEYLRHQRGGEIRLGKATSNLFRDRQTRDRALDVSDFQHVLSVDPQTRVIETCLLYTSPSPRDRTRSRMPSSA